MEIDHDRVREPSLGDQLTFIVYRVAYFIAAYFIVKFAAIGAFIAAALFNGGQPNWPGTPIGIVLALAILYGAYRLLRFGWRITR